MFTFDKIDLQRIAVSSVGAMALSAACIVGVAGPARAGTVGEWQSQVERQLDQNGTAPAGSKVRETDVSLRFNDDGRYAGASVVKSSGNANLDRAALDTIANMTIPALPEGKRNHAVVLRMLHDAPAYVIAAERAKDARQVQYAAANTGGAIKVAVK